MFRFGASNRKVNQEKIGPFRGEAEQIFLEGYYPQLRCQMNRNIEVPLERKKGRLSRKVVP
jgi:hypothetical protein